MRGKAGTESSTPTSARITPAYAGKRNGQSPTMLLRRDHPRVCGEKNAILSGRKTEPGSPPRMRGKVRELLFSFHCARITPAYAGKSLLDKCNCVVFRDHPRVCGEKSLQSVRFSERLGSPPRMRGKDWAKTGAYNAQGITPAYAGKSHPRYHCPWRYRDHPRVCGEKTKKIP